MHATDENTFLGVLVPWTREVFKLSSFDPEHWIMVFGVGSLMLVAMALWKAGPGAPFRH